MFRLAKKAFAEANKKKLVELIERSMHVRELMLEGRRDKEARNIIERRPSFGNEVELLNYASNLYAEWGKKEVAHATASLAKEIAKNHQRDRDRPRDRDRRRDRERDDRERRDERREEKPRTERQIAEQQVEILLHAAEVLKNARRGDAAAIVAHYGRALRFRLQGKKGEKAMHVYKTAPDRRQTSRFLGMAAEILQDQSKVEQAQMVAKLARQFAGRKNRERGERERRDERREKKPRTERQIAEQQVEILMFAAKVLDEAKRGDASETVEHAGHALKLRLQGKRGEEAMHVIKTAPDRGKTARFLGLAAEILQDEGKGEQAQMVAKLARQFAGRKDRERDEGRRDRGRDSDRKLDELHERMEHMGRLIEEMQRELNRMKGRKDH